MESGRGALAHAPPLYRSSPRRPRNMALLYLHLSFLIIAVTAEPAPGRIPKVYNALITSNQNLEPSKAYPVYQPVLRDAYYPYQSGFFYGDYPINNGLLPPPGFLPRYPNSPQPQPQPQQPASPQSPPSPPSDATPQEDQPPSPSEQPQENSSPAPDQPKSDNAPPASLPPPPSTESPIPLNQFGLPSQVIPLSHYDPTFHGFSQIRPFTYSYPGVRYYDPYDAFNFNPYANLPPVFQLPNTLGQTGPSSKEVPAPSAPSAPPSTTAESSPQTPPQEPSDLNVLNYSSKDPAIPNVPPPPLPEGGLKTDDAE